MAQRGGQIGNTNAAKNNRMVTDALRRAVAQNPDKLRKACLKVLDDAVEGNLAAFSVIADRLDGKPEQAHTVGNDESGEFTVNQIIRTIIESNASNTDS
jgi:hypothetical protein